MCRMIVSRSVSVSWNVVGVEWSMLIIKVSIE